MEWTNRSLKAQAEYGIELWEVSKPGMEPRYTFCAELGSPDIDHDGYIFAPDDRIDTAMEERIMAALDYVKDKYGFTWQFPIDYYDEQGNPVYKNVRTPENFGYAVAQLAVWSIIETDLEGIRGSTGIETYWDVFGPALQDVLDNSLDVYRAKLAAAEPGVEYVSGIEYLCPMYRKDMQHQLFPLFDIFKETKKGDGVLIIGKEMGKKASYGSVTGGYTNEAVPDAKGKYDHSKYMHNLDTQLGTKGNWFQFNTIAKDSIGAGATFDLVTGDKLKKVGEYDIIQNADGTFTITLRPNDALVASGAKFSISNLTEKGVKNKNDFAKLKTVAQNPIWTSAPGQQQFGFNGHSYTFSAPWVDPSKPIFVYIHLSLNGYEDTSGVGNGATWDFLVTGPTYPNGKVFTVPTNGLVKIDKLKAGEYTIQELAPGWEASYSLNGAAFVTVNEFKVTVADFNTQTVNVKNKQVLIEDKGKIAIQKLIETHDYGFIAGDGFRFAAFAIDDDGNPVGDPIGYATSDLNGYAYFEPSKGFVKGNLYYVVEIMTEEQELNYHFGIQGEFVLVEAIGEFESFDTIQDFKNNLNHGGIVLSMSYQVITQKKISSGTVTGWGETSFNANPTDNGNWFEAHSIDIDKIIAGQAFTDYLICGNPKNGADICGTFTVSAVFDAQDVFVGLKVELNYYSGIKASDVTMVVFGNVNQGTTNSGWGSGNDGSGCYKGSVGGSILIPAADIAKLAPSGGKQYLFVHSKTNGGTAQIDVTGNYPNETFWFTEDDLSRYIPSSFTFSMDGVDGYEFECEPGAYTLHCLTGGWTYTCICDGGPVCVAEGFVCDIEVGGIHYIEIIAKKIV